MNVVLLRDIAETTSGGTPSRENSDYYGDSIFWVKSGELKDGIITKTEETISEMGLRNSSAKLFPPGTLLIALYGATVGKLGVLKVEAATNQAVCAIFTSPEVNQRFLFFYLLSQRENIISKSTGGAQPNISQEIIQDLQIPLPPLSEQKRIAAILDKADRLRRQRRYAQTLSDSFLQSIFIKMFGDPVGNPMKWKAGVIGDEVESMQYGPRFYNEVYSPTGVRIIRITDLDNLGNLNFEAMPTMEVSDADIENYALKPGDLIFARSGATVGKTALIPERSPVCIAGAYFITMRFNKTVNPVFVRNLFASKPIQAIIERNSRQSAQQNFSGPHLRNLPLPLPPLSLQEQFAAIVQKFERIRRQQREATRQAEHLFQTLLHRAFRGEL